MLSLLLLLICLLPPVQALAIPLSYDFSGTLGDGGSISGSLSYDSSATPVALNVRGLQPNQVYAPTSWNFTIHSPYLGQTFTGTSLEFCTGKCIFGTLESTTLRVETSGGVFQMGFDDLAMTSLRLNSSHFRFLNPATGGFGLNMLTSGQATQATTQASVPLPGTFWSFLIGMGGLVTYLRVR
jgi:hypothetical protein